MPLDIDQVLSDAAAAPSRSIDTKALRARVRRSRRRQRALAGVGVLAIAAAVVVGADLLGGGRVELGPAAPPADGADDVASDGFVVEVQVEPHEALAGVVELRSTDPGFLPAGGRGEHELFVTVVDGDGLEVSGLHWLDEHVEGADGGALRIIGPCGEQQCPTEPIGAEAGVEHGVAITIESAGARAGTYRLQVSLSGRSEGAPSPPVILTYRLSAADRQGTAEEDGGAMARSELHVCRDLLREAGERWHAETAVITDRLQRDEPWQHLAERTRTSARAHVERCGLGDTVAQQWALQRLAEVSAASDPQMVGGARIGAAALASPCSAPVVEEYVVQEGDALYSIAETVYGDGHMFRLLADVNHVHSGTPVERGQVLEVPALGVCD